MLFGLTTSDRFAEKRMNRKIEKPNIQDINMTYITKFLIIMLCNQVNSLVHLSFLIIMLCNQINSLVHLYLLIIMFCNQVDSMVDLYTNVPMN
jgi:hypothetical protein